MKKANFSETRQTITRKLCAITKSLNNIIRETEFEAQQKNHLPPESWDTQMKLNHIYLVNEYLLEKMSRIKSFTHEGMMNNPADYYESDLTLVDTMMTLSLFNTEPKAEFSTNLFFSKDSLHLKINRQIYQIHEAVKVFPNEIANNYIEEFKLIPGIKLDFFQIVYLGITHMLHHINQISTEREINQLLELQSVQQSVRL